MKYTMVIKLVFILVLSQLSQASTTTCNKVSPSEYAYHGDSVTRSELPSANCMRYPTGTVAPVMVFSQHYIHCNGTQLRLSDSDTDIDQTDYHNSYYYEWSAGTEIRQLLFTFPTRVNLTSITLHYYSDSQRGLPPLSFYAAPDDFNIWDAVPTNNRSVPIAAVRPGGAPEGSRNASVDFNFNTKKVLMVKAGKTYKLAVSEVTFYASQAYDGLVTEVVSTNNYTTSSTTTTQVNGISSATTEGLTDSMTDGTATQADSSMDSTSTLIISETVDSGASESSESLIIIVGIIVVVMVVVTAAIAVIVLVAISRKKVRQKVDNDGSYSALSRSGQQLQQQETPNSGDCYDHIQLSPLTGQTEVISKTENVNSSQGQHIIHPSVEEPPRTASPQTENSNTQSEEANFSEPTYAVVNKKQKKRCAKSKESVPTQENGALNTEKPLPPQNAKGYTTECLANKETASLSKEVESTDELYTAVKKKPKGSAAKKEEPPPIPAHTVEELYTAVNKIPKVSAATKEEEEAPPIPPHTVEELYTAVNKTPKGNPADNEEEAPPIPPYTVEELYTAVNKTTKGNAADNEEEAPPIPPYNAKEQ